MTKRFGNDGRSTHGCTRHSPPIEPQYKDWRPFEIGIAIVCFCVVIAWMILEGL